MIKRNDYYPDFYNDVFGPVMQAGSSSHTAAPCRVGYLTHSILDERLAKVEIYLDENGSFAGTFGVMNEDLGMLSGAYGFLPDDVRIFSIKEILKKEQIPYQFYFTKIEESSHINAMKFVLTGESGKRVSLVGNSTGGGRIEIVRFNDFDFHTCGDSYVLLLETNTEALPWEEEVFLLERLKGILFRSVSKGKDENWLHCFYCSEEINAEPIRKGFLKSGISVVKPILPVVISKKQKKQLFSNVTEWIKLCVERNKNLTEIAIEYQMDASGWEKEDVIAYMKYIERKMYGQTHAVFEQEVSVMETPFSGFHFDGWSRYMAEGNLLISPMIALAIKYAYAAIASVYGVQIVPGPMGTGGGILYAVLCAAKESGTYTEDDLLRGLFVAAGMGAVSYTVTDPTGEVIGCAGECGVCSAMAAAGLTEMRGGTKEQVEAAASMALQAALGWPCDPIPGGDHQPCASRVVAAVVLAVTFSEVALSGKTSVLPFHEVLKAADKIGRSMPRELLCTSKGGCCDTPAAHMCADAFLKWRMNKNEGRDRYEGSVKCGDA